MAGVMVVRLVFFRMTDIGLPRRRVLVLGNGPEAEEIIRYLHEGELVRAVQYAGMYPVVAERETGEPERRINHDQLMRTVRDLRVSEIVIAAGLGADEHRAAKLFNSAYSSGMVPA